VRGSLIQKNVDVSDHEKSVAILDPNDHGQRTIVGGDDGHRVVVSSDEPSCRLVTRPAEARG